MSCLRYRWCNWCGWWWPRAYCIKWVGWASGRFDVRAFAQHAAVHVATGSATAHAQKSSVRCETLRSVYLTLVHCTGWQWADVVLLHEKTCVVVGSASQDSVFPPPPASSQDAAAEVPVPPPRVKTHSRSGSLDANQTLNSTDTATTSSDVSESSHMRQACHTVVASMSICDQFYPVSERVEWTCHWVNCWNFSWRDSESPGRSTTTQRGQYTQTYSFSSRTYFALLDTTFNHSDHRPCIINWSAS